MLKFFDRVLRGVAQVMFQNHPWCGLLILIALSLGSWQVALGTLFGSLISTTTAIALKYDSYEIDHGVFGYNGALIGAAYVALLIPGPMMFVGLVLATAFSAILMFRMNEGFKKGEMPVMTFPFVILGWLGTGVLAKKTLVTSIYLDLHQISFAKVILKNISQVFLVENALAGLIICLALALASFWAPLYALFGSVVASGLALLFELEMDGVGAGLYGFSAVLTSLALGCTFQTPSWISSLYALAGIALSVGLQVLLNKLFGFFGVPAFTAPFLVATWTLIYVQRALQKKTT